MTRTTLDKLRDWPHLFDTVSEADRPSVTDWGPKIQAALATGERFVLPRTELVVGSTIAIPPAASGCGLTGQGYGSVLRTTMASAHLFDIGAESGEVSGLRMEEFRVRSLTTVGAGLYAFNCRRITDSEFINLRVGSRDDYYAAGGGTHYLRGGYRFDRLSQLALWGGEIVCAGKGVFANGQANQTFGAGLYVDGGLYFFRNSVGVHLGGGFGGLYLEQTDLSECGTGLLCDDTVAGVCNREVFVTAAASIDNSPGWGIRIAANGCAHFEGNGGWISGCGKANDGTGGIVVEPARDGMSDTTVVMRLHGFNVKSNRGSGLEFSQGVLMITGGSYYNNGDGQFGGHGIWAAGGSRVSGLTITGATIFGNGTGNAGKANGIRLSGAILFYSVTGNVLFSNAQGGIYTDVGTNGKEYVIADNAGQAASRETWGVATAAAGSSGVAVAHGLGTVPSLVLVTILDGSGNGTPDGSVQARVTTRGPKGFTFDFGVVLPEARQFMWLARI